MAFSTIERKKCKCGCFKYPTLGYSGWNFACAPEEIKEKVGSRKDQIRKNKNTRNAIKVKMRAEIRKEDKDTGLELFFRLRRQEMTGRCIEEGCCNSTNKDNEHYWKWSICHIVPKSLVESVATNQYNWLELCQLHHQEFDNTFERAAKMKCFSEAKRKFELFKHLIPNEEMRKVSPYLQSIQPSTIENNNNQ